MSSENKFLDKITLTITIVCIVIISVTGIIFLNMENKSKSIIMNADDSTAIEQAIDHAIANNSLEQDGYDAATYGLININTADKNELMLLENIGEKRAEAIIEYRNLHPFKTINDITKVSGIGEKIFENIKDKICVE